MKTKILFFSFFLVVFIACNSSSTFSQFDKMPENNHWEKSDAKVYEFDITDDNQQYDIRFQFSHVYGYQFAEIPIDLSFESPDGQKENFGITLTIKDRKGQDLGDCSGDICDLTTAIREKTKLQKGHYKITVSHSFKGPYLPNVIGIGLDVDKAK